MSVAENAFEKGLHQIAKAVVDGKQHDKRQHEQPGEANDNFHEFEKQPEGQQAGDKNGKGIFHQIIHSL